MRRGPRMLGNVQIFQSNSIECQRHRQAEPKSVLDIRSPSPSSAESGAPPVSNAREGMIERTQAGPPADEFQMAGGEDLESMLLLESASTAPDQSLMRCLLGETEDDIQAASWDAMDSYLSPAFGDAVAPGTPSAPAGFPRSRRPGLETGTWGFVPSLPCFLPEPPACDPAPPGGMPPSCPQGNAFFPVAYAQQLQAKRPRPAPWPLGLPQRAVFGSSSSSSAGSDEVQLLIKAAEAAEAGNLGSARAILARLNQHLLCPLGKPLRRAAFYFKEALSRRVLPLADARHPLDIVHKIGAYRSFSEVSPVCRFANFTANQALLEPLRGAEAIHIIDFEIGLGGQWASFLQEIALRVGGPPALRLTAVGSDDSLELRLAGESLCRFAEDLKVPLEFAAVEAAQLERLTPAMLRLREREAVGVTFSPWGFSSAESIASLLGLFKQISPRAVVVAESECEQRGFLEALRFYSLLFESLEAVTADADVIHRIEKFVLAPKIGRVVAAKCGSAPGKRTPPWRSLFVDAGLSPMAFSSFAEAQAESLVGTVRGRGFEVMKAHGSLLLAWQGRALVGASVWSC